MLKENLLAEIAVEAMNYQPSSLRDSQAAAQRAGSILKYAGIFEYIKKGNKQRRKPLFNFVKKVFANSQPANILVTTKGADRQELMVLRQAKEKKKIHSCYVCSQ